MNTGLSGSNSLSGGGKSRNVDLSTFARVKLRGGRWAPSWLHFFFYLACRRQERYRGTMLGPPTAAWNAIGASLALPWVLIAATLSKYVPFLDDVRRHALGYYTPGNPYQEWEGWLFVTFAAAALYGCMIFLFGWQYDRIMLKYSVYGAEKNFVPRMVLLMLIAIAISTVACGALMIAVYSHSASYLWIGSVAVIGMFVGTEASFRWWWLRWCARNGQRQESGS